MRWGSAGITAGCYAGLFMLAYLCWLICAGLFLCLPGAAVVGVIEVLITGVTEELALKWTVGV